MRDMTRRDVMKLAALGGVGTLIAGQARAAAPANLGVQLYTVRDLMGKDPEGTLKAIAAIGYKEVEVLRASAAKVSPMAKALGLNPISMHIGVTVPDAADTAALIKEAQSQGVKYIVLPYLMPNQRGGGAPFYQDLGAKLNVFGAELKKAGLVLCYHNHGFDYEPVADGRRALDVLMSASDPDLVKLELDVFWVSVSGNDPVALIKQYENRTALLHLKDKVKGFAPQTQETKVPPTTFTPLGQGAVDIPAVIAAGQAIGVAHYFVEQDHAQGSPIDALKASYGYLRSI